MDADSDPQIHIGFRGPASLKHRLEVLAGLKTAAGLGKVTVTDLLVAAAERLLEAEEDPQAPGAPAATG